MSILKKGTLCVIIGGCPENIGMIVEVLEHLGIYEDREDAYLIQTVTGRNLHQLWSDNELLRNHSTEAVTDRYKLRPLLPLEADDLISVQEESPVNAEAI